MRLLFKRVTCIFFFFLVQFTQGQNTLVVEDAQVSTQTTFDLDIALNTTNELAALQFDINYNVEGLELETGHVLSARGVNHNLAVSQPNEGVIRVIVYSASNAVIAPDTGTLLTLKLKSKTLPGNFPLAISNVLLSDASQNPITTQAEDGLLKVDGAILHLITTQIDFGRVPMESSASRNLAIRNDGTTALILTGPGAATPFVVQDDFPISIPAYSTKNITVSLATDAKFAGSKALTFQNNDSDALRRIQSIQLAADVYAVNEIYIGSGQGAANSEISIPVSISNMEAFNGFQFDVVLPNDVSYVESSAVFSARTINHQLIASSLDNNTLRFVAYSPNNTNFSGNDGELFSFKVIPNIASGTYTLPISNAIVSHVDLGNTLSDAYNGSVTVNTPYLSSSVTQIDYGNIPITDVQTTNVLLTNTGSALLEIDELLNPSEDLSFPLSTPTLLDIGENISVPLSFTPSQFGTFDKLISIRNNTPEGQKLIRVLANVFSPNYLHLSAADAYKGGSNDISLNLSNYENIRALQFDVKLPDGFQLDKDEITETSVLNNYTTSVSFQGNNTFRFVIYTLGNQFIVSGDETILKLPVFISDTVTLGQYTFEFSNVVLSNESNQNVASVALKTGNINVTQDTVIPVISLIGASERTIEVGTAYTDAGATATDNYDGDISANISTTGTVDVNTVGNYTLTYNVKDASENAAVAVTRIVKVVDTTLPVISLIGASERTIEVGTAYADAGATATDNYDGDISSNIITVGTVDVNIVRSYTLTYNVKDANDNGAMEVTRIVNVVDTTLPIISLIGASERTIEVGTAYTDAGATATDNYDGDISSNISTTGTVDVNIVGSYTLTYNVKDANENAAVAVIRTIKVVDTTLPVISLIGASERTIEVGTAYTDAGATATDNYDGDISSNIITVGTVDVNIVGSYTLTYNVKDANENAAVAVIRTIKVVDTTLPVISLIGASERTIEVGTAYTDAGATATDNYDGDISSNIITTGTVDVNTVGNYTLTYNVKDANENAAVAVTRIVKVVDTTLPVISLIGASERTIEVGTAYTDAGATATDNYDGDISANISTTGTVDVNIVGSYTLTYNVKDANDNGAMEVTRIVNVVDTTLPVISLIGASEITIEVGTVYTDAGATATDNYDGDISSNIIKAGTVDVNTVGDYTLTYNVKDTNENAALAVTRIVKVEASLSLKEHENISISVYPNPTAHFWRIKASIPIKSAELFDIVGRKVLAKRPMNSYFEVDVRALPSGVYLLVLDKKVSYRLVKL